MYLNQKNIPSTVSQERPASKQRHHPHRAQVHFFPFNPESTTDLSHQISQLHQIGSPQLTSSKLQGRFNKDRISHKSLSNLNVAQASDGQLQRSVQSSFGRNVPAHAQPFNQWSYTQMIPVHQADPSLSKLNTQAHLS